MLTAVNLGDDTDTTACVAGGLAGILYGYEGIPAEWIEALRGKDVIDACLFGGVYGDDLREFLKRFEDSLDGPARDFYGLDHDMFAWVGIWTAASPLPRRIRTLAHPRACERT